MVVLLISGVVITVLVYPALAIQLSDQPSAQLSTRLSDAWLFYTPRNSLTYAPRVRELWQGYEGLKVRDEATIVARCGSQSTVTIERLFIRGYSNDTSGAGGLVLGPLPALKESVKLQNQLEEYLLDHSSPSPTTVLDCIRQQTVSSDTLPSLSKCLILSPLPHDLASTPSSLLESHFLHTLTPSYSTSISGIPIYADSLVSTSDAGDAEYIILTFALKGTESDCQSPSRHNKWVDVVRNAVGNEGVVTPTLGLPNLLALQVSYSLSFEARSKNLNCIFSSPICPVRHFWIILSVLPLLSPDLPLIRHSVHPFFRIT